MIEHRWLLAEPGFGRMLAQLAELLRSGVRRPVHVAMGAVLLALGLLAAMTAMGRSYAPRVVLRVLEPDRDLGSMPALKRQLADYVREGVLTAEPLLELRRRYGLYPGVVDRAGAVAAFRRDIDVDVYQNYFIEARAAGDKARSARVMVSYRAGNRATALAVTRDLAALVVSRVKASRQEQAQRGAAAAEAAARSLQGVLAARYERLAAVRAGLGTASDPNLQVEVVGLTGSVAALERRLDVAEKRATALELGAASELSGAGLRFEVAEEAAAPLADRRGELRVAAVALTFLVGLPFVVLAAGAGLPSRRGA